MITIFLHGCCWRFYWMMLSLLYLFVSSIVVATADGIAQHPVNIHTCGSVDSCADAPNLYITIWMTASINSILRACVESSTLIVIIFFGISNSSLLRPTFAMASSLCLCAIFIAVVVIFHFSSFKEKNFHFHKIFSVMRKTQTARQFNGGPFCQMKNARVASI